jgi:hypothetical protein
VDAPAEQTPVEVTLVHAPACHFCEDAQHQLDAFAGRFPLVVREVGIDSVEGRRLVAAHRPAMSPLVLVDGAYFSAGRLPRRKLESLLLSRALRASDTTVPGGW